MRSIASCLSIVIALAVTACAPTPNSRGTGEVIDDAAITTRVNTEITQKSGLGEAFAINVNTYRGVVSLSGFVDTAKQKQAAEQAASRVPGVKRVENNLQLKPSKS
jgi:osmotically-inducible protein OsmY